MTPRVRTCRNAFTCKPVNNVKAGANDAKRLGVFPYHVLSRFYERLATTFLKGFRFGRKKVLVYIPPNVLKALAVRMGGLEVEPRVLGYDDNVHTGR